MPRRSDVTRPATKVNVGDRTLDVLDPDGTPQQLAYDAVIVGNGALNAQPPSKDSPALMPGATTIHIPITGDHTIGQLLGAQLIGHRSAEIAKRVDTYATALLHTMTVESISDLDLSYTPPLGSPWEATQVVTVDPPTPTHRFTAGHQPHALNSKVRRAYHRPQRRNEPMRIELLSSPGCPNAATTRTVLTRSLDRLGIDTAIIERVGAFPSPPILINGTDVMHPDQPPPTGHYCRLDLPTETKVLAALRQAITIES